MRLIYKLLLRTSIALITLVTIWAGFFYFTIIDEINDETDDALELQSELLIKRKLAGAELPDKIEGSNNVYFIDPIDPDSLNRKEAIVYRDSMIYIPEKQEKEPARVLETLFRDRHDQYYKLTVLTPTIEKEDLVEAIFEWIVLLYLGLLFTLIIINIWVFYGSLKPLYRLMDWMENYKLGAENSKLEMVSDVTEFRKLKEATKRHIERSEKIYEEQKLFIGNASHEMQTPLAICSNRIEWLMDKTELSEEQLGELMKTKQTLHYLARLNKTLLFLSKIENRQFPELTTVSINQLIKEQVELYEEIYSYKSIQLEWVEKGEFILQMNHTLATSLFTNLIKNSFVHTGESGNIKIELRQESFVISNSSEEGPLDSQKIFQRFNQTKKKQGSSGLGLVIVRSICNLYQLSIVYEFKNNRHYFRVER